MWFTQHCSPSLQWEQERPVTSPPTCLLRPRWWLHWALWVSSSGSRSFSLTSLCQRRGSFVYLWGLADKVIARVCVCVCFSAVLSSHLLGEVLNVVGKLGCFLCVLGSILLVIHAPQEQEVTSLRDMTNKLLEPGERQYTRLLSTSCGGRFIMLDFSTDSVSCVCVCVC